MRGNMQEGLQGTRVNEGDGEGPRWKPGCLPAARHTGDMAALTHCCNMNYTSTLSTRPPSLSNFLPPKSSPSICCEEQEKTGFDFPNAPSSARIFPALPSEVNPEGKFGKKQHNYSNVIPQRMSNKLDENVSKRQRTTLFGVDKAPKNTSDEQWIRNS